MTGRQRVLATLNRQKPDAIPFEIGGTDCSSVHVIAYKKLREKMGLPARPIACGCLTQLVAQTDDDVMDALGVDVEVLWFGSRRTKVWKTSRTCPTARRSSAARKEQSPRSARPTPTITILSARRLRT
jgi:hypothetical protein